MRLLVLVALCWPGIAADTALSTLRSSLIGMREKPPEFGGPRGATPQLTVVKNRLREWVEWRLATLSQSGDETAFERKLNAELHDAKLFCGEYELGLQPC